jgi:hypothetical protein
MALDPIPGSLGSLVTRRWRKADSNRWSHLRQTCGLNWQEEFGSVTIDEDGGGVHLHRILEMIDPQC